MSNGLQAKKQPLPLDAIKPKGAGTPVLLPQPKPVPGYLVPGTHPFSPFILTDNEQPILTKTGTGGSGAKALTPAEIGTVENYPDYLDETAFRLTSWSDYIVRPIVIKFFPATIPLVRGRPYYFQPDAQMNECRVKAISTILNASNDCSGYFDSSFFSLLTPAQAASWQVYLRDRDSEEKIEGYPLRGLCQPNEMRNNVLATDFTFTVDQSFVVARNVVGMPAGQFAILLLLWIDRFNRPGIKF